MGGLSTLRTLDHTVLLCRDLAAARTSYQTVLGLPLETDRPNWVGFRVGSALLSLRPRGAWSVCDDGPMPGGTVAVQLAFRVPPPAIAACHAEF